MQIILHGESINQGSHKMLVERHTSETSLFLWLFRTPIQMGKLLEEADINGYQTVLHLHLHIFIDYNLTAIGRNVSVPNNRE